MKNLIGWEHSINSQYWACVLDMINAISAADIAFIIIIHDIMLNLIQ